MKNTEITRHENYSQSDYDYLSGKGYSDSEILAIWERDAAQGKGPVEHQPAPDIMSYFDFSDFN